MSKTAFIDIMLPHAEAAIGHQHHALVAWAIGKAAVECGWNANNILIKRANNCLGIKAGYQVSDGSWVTFADAEWLPANTGTETGEIVPWRKFETLTHCFAELVRMWNDRQPYDQWRHDAMMDFERVYAPVPGHGRRVFLATNDVTEYLKVSGKAGPRGRLLPHWRAAT